MGIMHLLRPFAGKKQYLTIILNLCHGAILWGIYVTAMKSGGRGN